MSGHDGDDLQAMIGLADELGEAGVAYLLRQTLTKPIALRWLKQDSTPAIIADLDSALGLTPFLIIDDDGVGPSDWPSATWALKWAGVAAVNAGAFDPDFYADCVRRASLHRRFILIECNDSSPAEWLAITKPYSKGWAT